MLNLDELLGEQRVIRWKGKDYPVKEITLRTVLKAEKAMEDVEDAKNLWQGMAAILKELVPGLDTENIPVEALGKVFNYALHGDADGPLDAAPEPRMKTISIPATAVGTNTD